ncbi:MAG: hypothetical protein HY200_07830 [Nitrospirae bacterium]|nr:hypothetical protein [Nitrospirota bacterium]MBI3594853.1 hypothetical protein [Nitrospirota bacterium]
MTEEESVLTKPKKEKVFFLILIIVSGIAVFSLLFLAFEGDKVTIYTIEKYVLDREVFEKAFLPEVDSDERKKILSDLHHFFNSAKRGLESKERVAQVGGKLREVMEDRQVTRTEVQELEILLTGKP